jgi:hypothetical protein
MQERGGQHPTVEFERRGSTQTTPRSNAIGRLQ